MSILEKIKTDQLTARKARDVVSTSLLTTLIGEATKVSDEEFKKGITEITDEKVITTVKKFLKNAQETKSFLDTEYTRVAATDVQSDLDSIASKIAVVSLEIAILGNYLPQQMSEDELRAAINLFKEQNPDASMGGIMAHLKANYAGLYDGKMASQIAKG